MALCWQQKSLGWSSTECLPVNQVNLVIQMHADFARQQCLDEVLWTAALLKGYRRYAIKGRMYPALAKATAEDSIEGKVCMCLESVRMQYRR